MYESPRLVDLAQSSLAINTPYDTISVPREVMPLCGNGQAPRQFAFRLI